MKYTMTDKEKIADLEARLDGDSARLEWALSEAKNTHDVPYRIKMALDILVEELKSRPAKNSVHDEECPCFGDDSEHSEDCASCECNASAPSRVAEATQRVVEAAKAVTAGWERMAPSAKCHSEQNEFLRSALAALTASRKETTK